MVTNKDIKRYKNLVYKIVNKYRTRLGEQNFYIDWNEIEQVAFIALYNALEKYKPNNSTPFISYASTAIVRAILRQMNFDNKQKQFVDIDEFFDIEDEKQTQYDNRLDSKILADNILKAIKRLNTSNLNKNILIDILKGYSVKETAIRNNRSEHYISQIIYLNKGKLLNKLQGDKNE